MIHFTDGPAAGVVLELRRAPLYLRVVIVISESTGGEFDALDQLDDVPAADERITVYRRVGEAGWVHIDYTERKTGRRRGKTYATGEYAAVDPQPPDSIMRDTAAWRAWATAAAIEVHGGAS